MSEPVLQCHGLCKRYRQGDQQLEVLHDVEFTLQPSQRVAIIGPSGAGKSTLLQLLGGLDKPSTGEVSVAGHNLTAASDRQRDRLRNQFLGFVYQFHHLLPEFSALENVAMPLLIRGLSPDTARERAAAILAKVGLSRRVVHRPGELSGGERQRVAIARALVTEPACLLADEPTGNLDSANAEQVFELTLEMNRELGTSLVVVTHDVALAERLDSIWLLRDGVLQRQR